MKRTALLRRKPLRARSAKKIERDAEWKITRERLLAERPNCQARGRFFDLFDGSLSARDAEILTAALHRCSGRSTELHHVLQRSLGGTDHESNLLAVERCCHDEIHREIALSHRAGLLVHSYEAQR